jgi:hypothetical protein
MIHLYFIAFWLVTCWRGMNTSTSLKCYSTIELLPVFLQFWYIFCKNVTNCLIFSFMATQCTKKYWYIIQHITCSFYVGSEVSTVVVIKISVFLDTLPHSVLKVNRCFGGTCNLRLQGWRVSQARKENEADNKQSSALSLLSVDYTALYPWRQNSSSGFCSYSTACNILHTTT